MINNIFGIFDIEMQSKKKRQSKNKASNKVMEIDMMRIDPGPIGFTGGFSQEHKYSTMGELITVEQLIEKRIIMRLSRYHHVYRHHVQDK